MYLRDRKELARHISRYPELWTGVSISAPSESFTLQATNGTVFNPADATTYYIGQGIASSTIWPSDARIYVPRKCILKKFYLFMRLASAATNEQSTISIIVNWTIEYVVTSTYVTVNNWTVTNTDLSIPLNAWDYITIKRVTPTRSTNPTSVWTNIVLWCECSPVSITWKYVIQWWQVSLSPADGTRWLISDADHATTLSAWRYYIPASWTLVAAYVYIRCTPWSNENIIYSLRKNNTTDYDITTTAKLDAVSVLLSNISLSIPVSAWDYLALNATYPTWVTNPTSLTHRFIFIIQT